MGGSWEPGILRAGSGRRRTSWDLRLSHCILGPCRSKSSPRENKPIHNSNIQLGTMVKRHKGWHLSLTSPGQNPGLFLLDTYANTDANTRDCVATDFSQPAQTNVITAIEGGPSLARSARCLREEECHCLLLMSKLITSRPVWLPAHRPNLEERREVWLV